MPVFPSRMSLRNRSTHEGYGPTVSFGVTTQPAADVPPSGVVVVSVVVGLVGNSPAHAVASAAPDHANSASAARRPIPAFALRFGEASFLSWSCMSFLQW